jgi:peptide-methionine (R)-S-oxide reductase
MIDRRMFLVGASLVAVLASVEPVKAEEMNPDSKTIPDFDKWQLSQSEWKSRLSPEAYAVLRKEATERPFTSALNDEKRKGVYTCAGCGYDLFSSEKKFESGTGWPSFFEPLPNALGTKRDFKLVLPRTEYHCARCGGHQGHVFNDGPAPTGLRYCNNGVALGFRPDVA